MPIFEDRQRLNAMSQKLAVMAGILGKMYEDIERVQTELAVMTNGLNDGAPATLRGRMSGLKDHVGISRNAANGLAAGIIEYANGLGR